MIQVFFIHKDFGRASIFLPFMPVSPMVVAGPMICERIEGGFSRGLHQKVFESHYPIIKTLLGNNNGTPCLFVTLGEATTPF